MKIKFWTFIYVLIFITSCNNTRKLDGNFSICDNSQYLEVYFEKDSVRVASENEAVGLSEWRKIEIINDTLYFESFGEWKMDLKARINYMENNNVKLLIAENGKEFAIDLTRIDKKLDFENKKEFWQEFNKRFTSRECK